MAGPEVGRTEESRRAEIEALLQIVCSELALDVAFIGRVIDDQRVVRFAVGGELASGDAHRYDETYCRRIVDGGIGPAIGDVSLIPGLNDLELTKTLRIASYLGIPLVLSDGSLYGTLCAYGHETRPDLGSADARLLNVVARLVCSGLEAEVRAERQAHEKHRIIERVLEEGQPTMVFQPIVDVASRHPVGFEALARFSSDPYRPPDRWIADAALAGLGVELEIRAIKNALALSPGLPAEAYLTVNASPDAVMSGRLPEVLAGAERPLIVEVTEHDEIGADSITPALDDLRAAGHRIALDDGGSGYSGLQRLLDLRPDVLKLDRSIVSGVDADPARQALVGAAAVFAAAMTAKLVAEGVETEAEADTLRRLGVTLGQGYLFGRPSPADTWVPAGESARVSDIADCAATD